VSSRNASAPQLRHLRTALRALTELQRGDAKPETLHRLRTHLRRLQAYLELIGDTASAEELGQCVSRSSRLRALQVFEGYLLRNGARRRDLDEVRKRIKKGRAKLLGEKVYNVIQRRLQEHAMPVVMFHDEWMSYRLEALRQQHAAGLRALHRRLLKRPRRRLLHRIRLSVKTIRYQEEWVLDGPFGRPVLVERLKRIQSVLGAYEDCAQFRKWAASWNLRSRSQIEKDWWATRQRARGIGGSLVAVMDGLASRRLWLVPRQQRIRV
jgi:CHAD domain-containing protein